MASKIITTCLYHHFHLFFEGQPGDKRSSQAGGSLPHTAAMTSPAAAWPSAGQ